MGLAVPGLIVIWSHPRAVLLSSSLSSSPRLPWAENLPDLKRLCILCISDLQAWARLIGQLLTRGITRTLYIASCDALGILQAHSRRCDGSRSGPLRQGVGVDPTLFTVQLMFLNCQRNAPAGFQQTSATSLVVAAGSDLQRHPDRCNTPGTCLDPVPPCLGTCPHPVCLQRWPLLPRQE